MYFAKIIYQVLDCNVLEVYESSQTDLKNVEGKIQAVFGWPKVAKKSNERRFWIDDLAREKIQSSRFKGRHPLSHLSTYKFA